jgi:hypothetical protein
MTQIELRTRIGPDGILTLSVPVGIAEANREVKVVIEPAKTPRKRRPKLTREEWAQFVDQTAGAWQGDLERPEQGGLDMGEQAPSQEYPTANFIEPTEYNWDLDYFVAEQAVRKYLEDSHADR